MSRFSDLRSAVKGVIAKDLIETIDKVVAELDLETDKDEDTWFIRSGSAVILIEIIGDAKGEGILLVHSPLAELPKTNLVPLYRYLLEENFLNTLDARLFLLNDRVHIGSVRLVAEVDRKDIESMLETVLSKADDFDDYIVSEFGAIPLDPD